MQSIEQLIEKFWLGRINDEEEKELIGLLSDKQNSFIKSLENEFHQHFVSGNSPAGDPDNPDTAIILSQLLGQITKQQRQKKARIIFIQRAVRWTAAAVITGVIVLGIGRWSSYKKQLAQITSTDKNEGRVRVLFNKLSVDTIIRLTDQSTVVLYPGSSISYYDSFDSVRRDISLKGKAVFTVAKDPVRPFTVYANGIATTALGTQFAVSTLVNDKVQVRLMEGRIVIRLSGHSIVMQDVYLKPGEEFTIDQQSQQYAVKEYKETGAKPADAGHQRNIVKPLAGKQELVFNQDRLSDVLTRVGHKFDVHFIYKKEELPDTRFTGKFMSSDSLPVILSVLSTTQRLSFKEQGGDIFVDKLK